MDFRGKGARALVFWALIAVLMAIGLGRGLWTPDEPREAEIGREMTLHPGFVPHLNARPFFEKPPLYYWAMALSYDAAGVSPAPARAVSALAGLATLALLFLWAKRAAGSGVAYRAVFLLATSAQFFQSTHWVLLDPLLMLLVTLALWGAWEALSGTSRRVLWLAAFYGGMSLALWSKGLVGMILPIGGLTLFLLSKRKEGLPALQRLSPLVGLPFLVLFTGLCVGAFYLAEGRDAVYQLVWVNHVLRLVSPTTTGHAQPFYYYAEALPVALLPWLAPFLALFRPRFWRSARAEERPDLRPFLGTLAAGGVLLLSLASTKRETYLLPLLPPLAFLMALAWEDATQEADAPDGATTWLFGRIQTVFLSAWGLVVPVALVVYTHSPKPAYILLGLLALVAGVAGVAWGFRGALSTAWEAHRVSAVILCVAVVLLAVPVAEPQKDMLPFARWVGFSVPGSGPIVALGADETLCGIIPFATGRTIEPLSAARWEELGASGDGPPYLLEQCGADGSRSGADRLGYGLVREQNFGPGRTLRLWKRAPEMESRHP